MESRGYDPTLPLDFDGSSNMIDLPEVTLGSDPSSHDVSASSSRIMSPGSALLFPNLLGKSNSGRMSPVRGRTMKEYDQQITDLKKENFSLKLRIYFLEERMQQKYGDGEDVFKTNIELKVNVQSLKKELEDKQELLRKASQAMETLTSSQQSDIDSVKKSLEEQHHKYTEELRSDLQKALQDAEDARDELESGRERMNDLEVRLQQMEIDQQQSAIGAQKLRDAIEMKEREISALQLESDSHARDLDDLQRRLQETLGQRDTAQHRVQQLEKDLQRRGRDVERLSTVLKDTSLIDGQSFLAPSHLQDVVDDQQDNLGQLEVKVTELEDQLHHKDDVIGRLEEGLREKEKAWKDATNQLQQLNKELEEEKHLGGRRDKTIIGLVSSLHKKEKEVASTKSRLSKSEGALKTMRAELHEAEMASHQEQVRQMSDQLAESENSNRRLQTQLNDANTEVENMIKSLGKKEGELAGFREQLQQANQALKRSEEALEGLQEQLEKERSQAHCRLEKQAQDFQRSVEEYLQQLEGKDSLMAHMTAQLRAKDQQLSSLMDLLTDDTHTGQKVLLQKLEDDLNKSSGSAQSALEERQAEVDRKGRELRETRQALQDKGRELEQANLQLLDKQEELERVELRGRQQGEAAAQLSSTLAKAQQSLEEALDRHAKVLKQKDAIVERLQKALAEKECMIEELTNQSPSTDKQQQQLRAQLREKDQLIQDLQTDCVKACCEKEQAMRSSQTLLMQKEEEIQALSQKQQKEVQNRDQEIQQLMSQLGKKDLQLESLQSRLTEADAQHREALHNMRRMLTEKDRTIEALVDSVEEKERLLRRSQQNLTEDAKAQMAEMDTLLTENSRLKRLLREKEGQQIDALQEEIRQRHHYDNKETHHTSYHETVTHTHTADNTQVCHLLEEQIKETQALSELLLRHDRQGGATFSHSDHRTSHFHSREEEGVSGGGGRPSEAEVASFLQAELSAVSALRERLQEGVEKNQQLHRSLLEHTSRHADHMSSGDSSPDNDNHPGLSSVPLRSHRHQHQQLHGGSEEGDGGPGTSKLPNWTRPPQGDVPATPGKAGADKTSLAVQTSPFLTHTLFDRGGPLSKEDAGGKTNPTLCSVEGQEEGAPGSELLFGGNNISEELGLTREASQDSVVSSLASLSSADLEGLSGATLRDLVSQLQEDLVAAAQRNTQLQSELQESQGREGVGGSVGILASTSTVDDDLQVQLESLKIALQLKDEEMAQLHQHLGLPSELGSNVFPAPTDLHSQVHHLRHQVKDMNKVNKGLKRQIKVSKEVNDPQFAAMAMEIERLKAENSELRRCQGSEGMTGRSVGVQEVSMGGDVFDGNGHTGSEVFPGRNDHMSDTSLLSVMSPPGSFSQEISHNTNRRTDSSLSQCQPPVSLQWNSSLAPSISQASQQSDPEWAPRLMQGESSVGGKLPPLAKMKLAGKDGSSPSSMLHMGRRLQDSQEQVQTLEERLAATEGTVRYMSQRLRHYRSLLQAVKRGGGVGGMEGMVGGMPRSQSESCLLPQPRLSLSLSCSDLREAVQSAGGLGAECGSGTDMSAMMAVEQGLGQSAAASRGQKGGSPSKNSHAILSTLTQHINAMKERYCSGAEVDPGKPGVPQVGGPPRQQEEDGGSNMSGQSSQLSVSRETARRDLTSHGELLGRHTGRDRKGGAVMSDDITTVTMSEVSGSRSEWCHNQTHLTTTTTTSSLSRHGNNARPSLSPQEVTFSALLGDDVLDGTAMDNLTYSSFSESILPMGPSQGHQDSAWSLPRGVNLPGRHGATSKGHRVDKECRSAEHTEAGSSGDEAMTYDGNGTLHSNNSARDASSQGEEEDSSRLKTRVMVLTDMNRTLREELSVYDTLCRSLGVQVSVEGAGSSTGEVSGEETCDGQMRLLQLHLVELKRLRARLEQLDTEAHNAVQVTSLLNNQHIQRITELEAALARLGDQLSQQRAHCQQQCQASLAERDCTIAEREKTIAESGVVQEQQERELQLLRENLAAVQELEAQRQLQQEGEMEGLRGEVEGLRGEAEEARRQARELEQELEDWQQRRQSYDVRLSQSQQHLLDLEAQLTKARRRVKGLEAELHASQASCQTLEADLATSRTRGAALDDDVRTLRQSIRKRESELKESGERASVLETRLGQSEREKGEVEEEVRQVKERVRSLEEEVGQVQREREAAGEEVGRLQEEVAQARREVQEVRTQASQSASLQEECRQQQQRAQHYQERMAHYEQCMRDYQHRVHDCETQLEQLKSSLQSSQSREQEADGRLHQALTLNQQLQAQVKDAESRAHTNESMAHRADTLARTMEARLRELEAKVKDTEERAKESEYELRVSQSTASGMSMSVETLKKELSERSAKLKKRDAQLKKLVEEYKKVMASQKETSQLNQTLKTEIKLYESMTSQTELSRDKKEELMRQLLTELSQTRRLAEDLISRLEHNKRNDSPASTAGPEAADGRPSPEPRDSLHSVLSETNILRVHTDTHTFTADSQASSLSEHTDTRHTESPPVSTPLSSPGSSTFSGSGCRPKTTSGVSGQEGEMARSEGQLAEGESRKGADSSGGGHLRSYSHPASLKYWRDHPMAAVSGSSVAPRVEVDSDVRRLFAISGLEGYEKLKRENGELLTILSAMQARMAERLKAFTGVSITESVEYSTLRELQMSAQNLRICAEEEGRLLSCFWLTQLPPINARGEFYDPKLADENDNLKGELRKQKSRYDLLAHTVREQQERLHATNSLRKKWETTLYKQYEHFFKHQLTTPALRAAAAVPPFVPSFSDPHQRDIGTLQGELQ
ncbi:uncharacterized protein LOC143276177 isoform X2 [Babylonia areolata]|uniref:uncharacterized protein LOC143276177 isoform X2 n=1 Tax=Babylonia areolata TaxID=304850 RepID=UPI003FD2F8F5